MDKFRSVSIIFFVLLFLLSGCSTADKKILDNTVQEKLVLKLSSHVPREHYLAANTRFFEEELEKSFGDRLQLSTFYGGTLVKDEQIISSLGQGVVDICTGVWIFSPGLVPLGSFEYNFIFNDPDVRKQAKIKREMYERLDALNQELRKNKIGPPLVFGPLTEYVVFSKKPIKVLDDLKGLKVGFTPTEYVPVFEAAKAVPVISPASELYERLDRGVVDAIAISKEIAEDFSIQEVAPHILEIGINTPTTMSTWINLETFENLAKEDSALLLETGRKAEERYLEYVEERLKTVDTHFKKCGVTYTTFNEEDFHRWVNAIPNLPNKWADEMTKKGLPGSEIVNLYVELSNQEGWTFPYEIGQSSP